MTKKKKKKANITWDKARAEKSLQCLDRGESLPRKKAMEFDRKQGWKVLGYDSCMDCLKDRLKYVSASTIYRYIQAGKVELALGLDVGSQVLTSMLEICKYAEDEWDIIWDKITEERPSVALIKATINLLIKGGEVEPLTKNERAVKSIAVRMKAIIVELKEFDAVSLDVLHCAIVSQIASFDDNKDVEDFED